MSLTAPSVEQIREAQQLARPHVLHTPLVQFHVEGIPVQIFLKLENLQVTGSFKVRGACGALLQMPPKELSRGIWTASAGNMGAALAHLARRMGIPCTVIIPDDAPAAKVALLQSLGAALVPLPFTEYQQIQRGDRQPGLPGTMIHPFACTEVMAGNAGIALEILDDLPDAEAILVPYGGGGLSCGIASAVRAVRPAVQVFAVESATGAPLSASLEAGQPVKVPFTPSFLSGMGAPFVFPQMWPLARRLLDGALVVSLDEITAAMRMLALGSHVIAEPAGAVSLAAALGGKIKARKIVCIVSGGNIDPHLLARLLAGAQPG